MNFIYDDKSYEVEVTRKNNRNLYIRVKEDLRIVITCPYLYTDGMIKKILEENRTSVISMIQKQEKKNETVNKEKNSLLGRKISVIYENVRKPVFDNNTLIIKDDNMLNNWYKKKAYEVFKIYLDEAYEVFEEKVPYPKLKVRNMKTRWGVCNRKDNSVTLNLELIKKDQEFLNYVIVHELSHFVHFDHSKNFWKTVEKYCPDYKRVRKALKE